MIENFKPLRLLPQFGMTIYLVKMDSGKSFYALVPDDVVLHDGNVLSFKISNTLFEYFIFCDFPNNEKR